MSKSSLIMFLCLFLTFGGCASTKTTFKSYPLNTNLVNKIISIINRQNRLVRSFVSYGTIRIREDSSSFSADVMIAATKAPFRIKIEVTHFWGRPLCYILIQDDVAYILSFTEQKYYIQSLGRPEPSGLFPFPLEKTCLWGILKGYPVLRDYTQVKLTEDNRIAFTDTHGNYVEMLNLCMDDYLPCEVLFPKEHVKVVRVDFDHSNDIIFAHSTDVFYQTEDIFWKIVLKQVVFNTDIPGDIFKLQVPPGYETVWE